RRVCPRHRDGHDLLTGPERRIAPRERLSGPGFAKEGSMSATLSLAGKAAIVTGASSGIGRAIAEKLGRRRRTRSTEPRAPRASFGEVGGTRRRPRRPRLLPPQRPPPPWVPRQVCPLAPLAGPPARSRRDAPRGLAAQGGLPQLLSQGARLSPPQISA